MGDIDHTYTKYDIEPFIQQEITGSLTYRG